MLKRHHYQCARKACPNRKSPVIKRTLRLSNRYFVIRHWGQSIRTKRAQHCVVLDVSVPTPHGPLTFRPPISWPPARSPLLCPGQGSPEPNFHPSLSRLPSLPLWQTMCTLLCLSGIFMMVPHLNQSKRVRKVRCACFQEHMKVVLQSKTDSA